MQWVKNMIEGLTSYKADKLEQTMILLGRIESLEAAARISDQVIEEYRLANAELLSKIQQLQKKLTGMETDCRMAMNALSHAVGKEDEACLLGPSTIEEAAEAFSSSCQTPPDLK